MATALLQGGALARPALAGLASLRPLQARGATLLLGGAPRRSLAHRAATSVTVRAAAAPPAASAADRSAPPLPASFGPLGVSAELQAALADLGISAPTEIQAAAVPALLRDRASDFALASHTGSGKTLAYLVPMGA